jgi:hypothetical protein
MVDGIYSSLIAQHLEQWDISGRGRPLAAQR